MSNSPKIERFFELLLFRSRWLIAPFYLGLVLTLLLLLGSFCDELYLAFVVHFSLEPREVILLVLTLIDLSLAANLVIIVIFSGYENFVSKIEVSRTEDRPSWMGTLDFSGLKMKLIGSIVAISVVALLQVFMEMSNPGAKIDTFRLGWMLAVHSVFLVSGVMFALMDYIAQRSEEVVRRHRHGPNSQ
jgi:uncharacterized protein (TIGR00645 family)